MMATRRTRLKAAPNLGLTRNKARKPAVVKPKIVIKSDTENSESEDQEDNVRNAVATETTEEVSNLHTDPTTVNGCLDETEMMERREDHPAVEITPMDLAKEIPNGNLVDIPDEAGKKDPDNSSCERLTPRPVTGKARLPMMRNKNKMVASWICIRPNIIRSVKILKNVMFYQLWTFGSNYLSNTNQIVNQGNKKEKQTEHIQLLFHFPCTE